MYLQLMAVRVPFFFRTLHAMGSVAGSTSLVPQAPGTGGWFLVERGTGIGKRHHGTGIGQKQIGSACC